MDAAAYPLLPTDTFAVEYAVGLMSKFVDPALGDPDEEPWYQIGEIDYLRNTPEVTQKEHWSKSLPVSQMTFSAVTRVKNTIDFKAMQRTELLRAYAMLGGVVPVTQTAKVDQEFVIPKLRAGDIWYVDAYNATIKSVKVDNAAIDAINYDVVDQSYTAIRISNKLEELLKDETAKIIYDQPAKVISEIQGGINPVVDVRLRLRGVSAVGKKGILDVLRYRIAPKGGQDYVTQNDEFNGLEFTGAALVTDYKGVQCSAVWRPLDK